MNIENPVIVIVAFNRLTSLKRLLYSLNNSKYEDDIKLIISVDRGNNKDVLEYANNFVWNYGEKEVIYQEINLGLKKHILKCGDLTKKYDSIILLEDDLYVSPYFYNYSKQAINFYKDDISVSQISLYKHTINNNTFYKFNHLDDNSDIFFMQFASSWGQIWTKNQWENFRKWFDKNDLTVTKKDHLPDFVINWKETSWLKYFIKYNKENNKFTLYPKISLTTNFSDLGTNVSFNNKNYSYQQSLLIENKSFRFKTLNESLLIYDSYYEIHDSISKKFIKDYNDVEFDLYGTKNLNKIKSKYLVSIKKCNNPIYSYARELKPHELNILLKNEGNDISFGLTSNFENSLNSQVIKENFKYFWTNNIDYQSTYYLIKIRLIQQYINFSNRIKKKLKR